MASRILEPGLELDGSRCHFPGEASCRAESATAIVRSLYYVITVELLPAELPGMKRTLGRGVKKKKSFLSSRFRLTIHSFGRQLFPTLPRNESYVNVQRRSACSNLKCAAKANVLLLAHRNEFTALLDDATFWVFWYDCQSCATCATFKGQSGKRVKDSTDFPSPLSRIRPTFRVPLRLRLTFDLGPVQPRGALLILRRQTRCTRAVARTACPRPPVWNGRKFKIWTNLAAQGRRLQPRGLHGPLGCQSTNVCLFVSLRLCLSACVRASERALPTQTAAQDTHLPAWTQKRIIV